MFYRLHPDFQFQSNLKQKHQVVPILFINLPHLRAIAGGVEFSDRFVHRYEKITGCLEHLESGTPSQGSWRRNLLVVWTVFDKNGRRDVASVQEVYVAL